MAARPREELRGRGALPRLIALSDCATHPDCPSHFEALCRAAAPGTVLVVVRDRQQSRAEKLAWARALASTARECGQRLSVADDLDLACELGADGLHLGAAAAFPSPEQMARLLAPSPQAPPLLTRSGHGWAQLNDAELERLHAVLLSPAWQERKGRRALGEEGLRQAIRALEKRAPRVAAYALGGVDAAHVAPSLAAGAAGVACIGALMSRAGRAALLSALNAERAAHEG